MMRLLWWVALAAFGWWLVRRLRSGDQPGNAPPPDARDVRPAPPPPAAAPAPMVRCVRCGLHLPAADAIFDAEQRAYCSTEHRFGGPA